MCLWRTLRDVNACAPARPDYTAHSGANHRGRGFARCAVLRADESGVNDHRWHAIEGVRYDGTCAVGTKTSPVAARRRSELTWHTWQIRSLQCRIHVVRQVK